MTSSSDLFLRAQSASPGGVHSPVRAFRHIDGQPIFIKSAQGSQIEAVDGSCYTDYCMAFGPLILGHNPSAVNAAVHDAVDAGWSFGTAEPWSLELIELIKTYIDWIDQVRFVNSGTEAVMTALRIARAATGRDKILKFSGCYHGHLDSMLVEAGSGMATQAASAGIGKAALGGTLVAPLDDEARLSEIFATHGTEIAAAIIEPLPANYGLLPQRPAFLKHLAELCRQCDSMLIFDEVISGFRIAFGGCTEALAIKPDLVTWGKIIGGGFPVGAVAGSEQLMSRLAPVGDVYQAGTLSANPVAMRAGLATLNQLTNGEVYQQLENLGLELETQLDLKHLKLQRAGSIFWFYPASTAEPRNAAAVDAGSYPFAEIFRQLTARGIYLPPSPYEVAFLSGAHTSADIAALAAALNAIDAELA
jgi:glutamate-1-semialdehyde 2,1-aminomutase